ncbi:MAG: hypothetical protein GY796_24655 [Chloroflexi bacterium]|nr:hypothetical protein [Chloroflexota bacterium]
MSRRTKNGFRIEIGQLPNQKPPNPYENSNRGHKSRVSTQPPDLAAFIPIVFVATLAVAPSTLALNPMDQVVHSILLLGSIISGGTGSMAFVIVPAVIALDIWLGFRYRSAWIFSVIQCIYFVAAWVWVWEVHSQNEFAGPFMFVLAVGFWGVITLLFHAWLFLRIWLSHRK